jgi:hypothetical protein
MGVSSCLETSRKSNETMSFCRLPKTAIQFMRAIGGETEIWETDSFPADPDDKVHHTKIVFWRADDPERLATIEDSHGQMLVCFAPLAHSFELDKLHEGLNGRSWRELLRRKSWCRPEHLAFMDTLCVMFPPSQAELRLLAAPAADRRPSQFAKTIQPAGVAGDVPTPLPSRRW